MEYNPYLSQREQRIEVQLAITQGATTTAQQLAHVLNLRRHGLKATPEEFAQLNDSSEIFLRKRLTSILTWVQAEFGREASHNIATHIRAALAKA